MIKFAYIFTLIILLPVTIAAQSSVTIMPDEIIEKIRSKVTEHEFSFEKCPHGDIQLSVHQDFYSLTDSNLLFFVLIPNYLCHSSNTFLPIIVSSDGSWKWDEFMDGAPGLFFSHNGSLWMTTQWQIEGTYARLYKSTDGIHYSEINLPHVDVDCCFEYIQEICFNKDDIILKFYGDSSNKVAYWSKPINKAIDTKTKWQAIQNTNSLKGISCSYDILTRGGWHRDFNAEGIEKNNIQFLNKLNGMVVNIPKFLFPKK